MAFTNDISSAKKELNHIKLCVENPVNLTMSNESSIDITMFEEKFNGRRTFLTQAINHEFNQEMSENTYNTSDEDSDEYGDPMSSPDNVSTYMKAHNLSYL